MTGFMERSIHDWTEDSVRILATPSLTARTTFFYVQEAGYFRTQPQYFTERQQLNSYLIVFTISGTGYLTYEGKTYSLSAGQAFFIDCMNYQHYKTDANDLWEFVWVHFNGATCRGYYEQYAVQRNPVLTCEPVTPIPSIINQIIDVQRNKDIRTEPICSKLLVELLTEFLLGSLGSATAEFSLPIRFQEIIKEIEHRYSEKISLDRLAEQFVISKFHLTRQFKKYTGYTPNEYLITTRINKAKEWLTYSDISVSEISFKVGIETVSHFIKLFREREGITPLAYRKKWRI